MKLQSKRAVVIIEAVLMMVILQTVRELIEYFMLKFVADNQFNHKMVTMSAMIILTAVFVFYSKFRKEKLGGL